MFNESFEQPKYNWEKRQEEISKKIEYLNSHCVDEKEFYKLLSLVNDLQKNLKKDWSNTSIELYTLPEFKYALETIGLDNELIVKLLAHENAHGNMADRIGAKHENYTIGFYEKEDGRDAISPMCSHITPTEKDGWSKEQWKNAEITISLAPDAYGEKSSPGDIERAEKIRKM